MSPRRTYLLAVLALLVAPSLCASSSCHGCLYAFRSPQVPVLRWGGSTVPDSSISHGNPIQSADGTPLLQVCNGDRAEYLTDAGTWTSKYIGSDGRMRDSFNTFYANGDEVRARTVQPWQRTLFDVLRGRTVRLWVDCNNGVRSCLLFKIAPATPEQGCEPDGGQSSSSGEWGDACRANLSRTQAQRLMDPPVLSLVRSPSAPTAASVYIRLPQMIPSRTNVSARFVNPDTEEESSVAVAMREYPCFFAGSSQNTLSFLLAHALPRIHKTEKLYTFEFAVRVQWVEYFELGRIRLARPSQATLRFSIEWERALALTTTVSGAKDWWLLSATSGRQQQQARLSLDGRSHRPYIEASFETRAALRDYAIVPGLFRAVEQSAGSSVVVSSPVLVGQSDGVQRWAIRADIGDIDVCSTAAHSFTLEYMIEAGTGKALYTGQLNASLEGLRSWCIENQTAVSGAQSVSSSLAGSVVHVAGELRADMPVLGVSVQRVQLAGPSGASEVPFIEEPCAQQSIGGFCYWTVFAPGLAKGAATLTTTVSARLGAGEAGDNQAMAVDIATPVQLAEGATVVTGSSVAAALPLALLALAAAVAQWL
eukprot:m51a1_g8323 hypothetical protein (594) ;mRNA; f:137751-139858